MIRVESTDLFGERVVTEFRKTPEPKGYAACWLEYDVKALSIRQPWAWLIVNGHKDIENRSWRTQYRGRVLIHASKGMTRAEYDEVRRYLSTRIGRGIALPLPGQLDRGGIVGFATITGCASPSERTSPWHMDGQFGFEIGEVSPLPFTACKGALGFFNVPADVVTRIRELAA